MPILFRRFFSLALTLVIGPALSLALLAATLPNTALADEDGVEELSYQDLVEQLRTKKRKNTAPQVHALDQISLHASIAMASSVNTYRVNDRQLTRGLNGFQIALGIDLFSPTWMSELALRNFGTRDSGTESQSQREVDLKVLHRGSLGSKMGFRAGSGLSTRYLRFTDPTQDINISQETPNLILVGGLDSILSDSVNIGAEFSVRSALVDQSMDRNSLDMMVRLETSF